MFKIVNRLILGKDIKRLDIEAPSIAQSFSFGQFVMVCPDEGSKWIPLTVVESDTRRGLISVIFKETGLATRNLGSMSIDDKLFSVAGPFGAIKEPKQVGVVVCVATGVSAAQLLPICRAYNRAGNKVIGVIGAVTKAEMILEPQMRITCHKIFLTTEDGSYQQQGKAQDVVKELLSQEDVKLVYSIGDTDMMREVAQMTAKEKIPNLIQVHTVMSCGRGICGSCRVKVNRELALACEEGPEFDGHMMDFEYLRHRMDHTCKHEDQGSIGAQKRAGFFKKIFEG